MEAAIRNTNDTSGHLNFPTQRLFPYMKVKDIVNREHVTLTNCESEPIHIPGAIQPHGFLLALKLPEFRIDFCSGNTNDYCGISLQQLLDKTFAQCFGNGEADRMKAYLGSEDYSAKNPLALQFGGIALNCTIHEASQDLYILEAEPFPDGFRNLPDLYLQTRKFVALLERTQSLKALCQTVAEETRAITGYDRVMIYRFDKEYNGEVIAEARQERLEPFLDLHYPHTDIPAQARELYLRNLMRMIADVHYVPVPIYTIDDAPAKSLDLSHSVLRSVSPIHIEYLKNMGVGATLTISLIHRKKLWGLIACHHYSPKNIPHYTRLSAKLQGHFLTSQIDVREAAEAFEASRDIAAALEQLLPLTTGMSTGEIGAFAETSQLLEIAGATGVAIRFNGVIHAGGDTPGPTDMALLSDWFAARSASHYATDNLGLEEDLPVTPPAAAAGVLYHSLMAGGANCILWFRREQKSEVLWAGDPSKAIVKDEKGLSPRKSFALWREQTGGQSTPWAENEQTAAANVAYALQKQFNLILLSAEEQRYRKLSEQLQLAYDDLERINWISTHDLQEPLRKIQVFASKLLGSDEPSSGNAGTKDILHRMSAAANRMQALLTDIHAYSRLLHTASPLAPVDLNTVLAEVMAELEDELKDRRAVLTITELPMIDGEPFLLKQVFTNLLRNALKFSGKDQQPEIRISSGIVAPPAAVAGDSADKYQCISIVDNGIGFSNEFADSIFELFRRLHSQQEYSGTGVGLALCRKIMERHKGYITAEGRPGEGAAFYLWFPLATERK